MFELRGASKRFGSTVAVAPVDFELSTGRTTVLIGPSGCGKSTLLRLLNGLLEPDAGRVFFQGAELTAANAREARLRMGYVIQEGGLFPHLSARDNAALMARHLGWEATRVDRRVDELCELLRLEPAWLGRLPQQLSGGQRQRVALMRALFLDPEVLLLDEPLGALDPIVRADLQHDLRAIFQSLGKTVVLVTHDLGEAAYLGDRLVLMRDGVVVQSGTLSELTERPADPFVTRFLQAQRSLAEAMMGGGAS